MQIQFLAPGASFAVRPGSLVGPQSLERTQDQERPQDQGRTPDERRTQDQGRTPDQGRTKNQGPRTKNLSLVLVPGIQGRWEYMRPAVDALSQFFDVHTLSLRADAASLDDYVSQVIDLLDRASVDRAVICGVSFGGLVALRLAAARPERASALVLASTPAPGFRLKRRHRLYARLPWIFGPVFLLETPWRLREEIVAALPDRGARRMLKRATLRTLCTARLSVSQIAKRALLMTATDQRSDCDRVQVPTLVVTGEAALDHVVPAGGSSAYAQSIRGARAIVLERTGHIGTVTRPEAFAAAVHDFVRSVRLQPDQVA